MSSVASVPESFGLVAAVTAASFIVHHIYMGFGVVSARKKYGIKYPDLYATKDNCKNEEHMKKFNCVQRGHQNSLENQPIFLAMLLTAGLSAPVTAAAFGAAYLIGRVVYFAGYATGKPEGRYYGAVGYIGTFGLLGICGKMAWTAISSMLS